jgi:imidazolonepropionase-like amidohydrolase
MAAIAVGQGLNPTAALRAVTLTPAEILHVADRVGSIEAGKDADLVIWNQPPLAASRRVETVLIDGVVVYQRKAPL